MATSHKFFAVGILLVISVAWAASEDTTTTAKPNPGVANCTEVGVNYKNVSKIDLCLECVKTTYDANKTCIFVIQAITLENPCTNDAGGSSEAGGKEARNETQCHDIIPDPPPTTTTPKPTTTNGTTTTTPTTTTTKPTTTTSPTTTTTVKPTTPTNGTTTTTPTPTTKPPVVPPGGGMSWGSFFGGIAFTAGISSVAYVVWRFYKARTERNYHTLSANLI